MMHLRTHFLSWLRTVVILFGGLLVAGAVAHVYTLAYRLLSDDGFLPRIEVIAPGLHIVSLDQASEYVIYFEANSDNPPPPEWNDIASLRASVAVKVSYDDVELVVSPCDFVSTYSVDDREGISLWQFQTESPSKYSVSLYYADADSANHQTFAIGAKHDFDFFIYSVAGVLLSSFVIGSILMRRYVRKRRWFQSSQKLAT